LHASDLCQLWLNLCTSDVPFATKELTDTFGHTGTELQSCTLRVATDDGCVGATLDLASGALRV
jgi:hypothetical protein